MSDLILFDVDGTIFDSENFGKLIRQEFMGVLKIDEEEMIRAIADYYSALESRTDFTPQDLVSYFSKTYNVERELLGHVFWGEDKKYKKSVFPDALPTLSRLSKEKTIGIFSQGHLDFQMRKLEAGEILDFFNKDYIFIFKRKLFDEAISSIPKDATIIENKHDVAQALSKDFNVVWINRKSRDSDPKIKTIHSLTEIL